MLRAVARGTARSTAGLSHHTRPLPRGPAYPSALAWVLAPSQRRHRGSVQAHSGAAAALALPPPPPPRAPALLAEVSMASRTVVDLTLSDSEEEPEQDVAGAAAAAEEEEDAAQRTRIMNFARAKAGEAKRARSDAGGGGSQEPPQMRQQQQLGGEAAAPGVGAACGISNADLRALHEARMRRQQQQAGGAGDPNTAAAAGQQQAAGQRGGRSSSPPPEPPESPRRRRAKAAAAADNDNGRPAPAGPRPISLLTYNVWFKHEVAVVARMCGLSDVVRKAGLPTFICLQEVTPIIQELLSGTEWWGSYAVSPPPPDAPYYTLLLARRDAADARGAGAAAPPAFKEQHFSNSVMGRSLRTARLSVGGVPLLVGTSHLESPIPPNNWYSKERQAQMAGALRMLDAEPEDDVLYAGDMNWGELEGPLGLPRGWRDAWPELRPGEPGCTWDPRSNPMLPHKARGLRLDRILCKLRHWRMQSVQLVGTEPIPGELYTHTNRNGGTKELPLLPSDHFGLLLRLEPAAQA